MDDHGTSKRTNLEPTRNGMFPEIQHTEPIPSSHEGSEPSLGARMAKGAAWTIGMRMAVRLLGVVSTIILARLLEPSDYGLIALATVFAAGLELLSSFSFDVWLIRHPDPKASHYNTVWTLTIISGAVTGVLLLFLATPASVFFGDPRLATVLRVLAISIAFASWKNVGVIDFQKHLRFDRDFVLFSTAKVGAFLVTVSLGILLRSYWALLAGIVTGHLLTLALTYWLHPYRPWFSCRHWHDAFHFSKWMLAGNLIWFIYSRADTFILGKLTSPQLLGLYTVAHEIATLATSELLVPVRRVLLPGYAQLQEDLPTLRRAVTDGFALILLIGVPCAVGLALIADPLVRVLLGPKWLDVIPLLQILVIYGVASIGMANQGPILIALGHARLASTLLAFGVVALVPSFIFATLHYGIWGGALSLGICHTLLFLLGLIAVLRTLKMPLRNMLTSIWRIPIATLAMVGLVRIVQSNLNAQDIAVPLILIASILVGAIGYIMTMLLIWRLTGYVEGPEHTIVGFARDTLWKNRKSTSS